MVNAKGSAGAWGWGGKAGFLYAGVSALITVWAFFRMPETGGFSFAELDILFANKISARKFTKVRVHDEAIAGDTAFEQGGHDGESMKAVQELEHKERV